MAGMDFSFKRNDRGMSVFWMILIMGVGVFGLLAIALIASDRAVEPIERAGGPAIQVNEGETTVNGVGNTQAATNMNDPTFLSDEVTVDGPLPTGEVPAAEIEIPVEPAEPSPLVEGTAFGDPAAEADGEIGREPTVLEREAAQPEIVTDPDGTTGAVTPTPSGPLGDDGNPLTID